MRPRQRLFVLARLGSGDAGRAALAAGYAPRRAAKTGSRLLDDPAVRRMLEKERRALERATGITRPRVIAEYARIAFADLRRLAAWDGAGVGVRRRQSCRCDDTAAVRCFAALDRQGRRREVRMKDKLAALAALALRLGLFDLAARAAEWDEAEARARLAHRILALKAAMAASVAAAAAAQPR